MKKMDELVWCFPACKLVSLKGLPGVSTEINDWDIFVKDILESCRFQRRGDIEEDPTIKQPIPYIVVRHEDKVLVYNRGNKGGEGRLADLFSIGVGGHINPDDATTDEPFEVVLSGATRELTEELTLDGTLPHHQIRFLGLLSTDDTPVNAVHFGVILEARFKTIVGIDGSDELQRHRWVPVTKLNNYNLESWSEMVLEEILLKE